MHYDERNWKLLAMAMQENHETFPPETRASLIDDIFSLAAVGLMKYETVFDFIKYMQVAEKNYLPWTALMRHVFKLNRLLYETTVFTDFQVSYENGKKLEMDTIFSRYKLVTVSLASYYTKEILYTTDKITETVQSDSSINPESTFRLN